MQGVIPAFNLSLQGKASRNAGFSDFVTS